MLQSESEMHDEIKKNTDMFIKYMLYTSLGIQLIFFGICYFSLNRFWHTLTSQIMFIGLNILAVIILKFSFEIVNAIVPFFRKKDHSPKLDNDKMFKDKLAITTIFNVTASFLLIILTYNAGFFAIDKAKISKSGNNMLFGYMLISNYEEINKIEGIRFTNLNAFEKSISATRDTICFAIIPSDATYNFSEGFVMIAVKGNKKKTLTFKVVDKIESLIKFHIIAEDADNETITKEQAIVEQIYDFKKEMLKKKEARLEKVLQNFKIFGDL